MTLPIGLSELKCLFKSVWQNIVMQRETCRAGQTVSSQMHCVLPSFSMRFARRRGLISCRAAPLTQLPIVDFISRLGAVSSQSSRASVTIKMVIQNPQVWTALKPKTEKGRDLEEEMRPDWLKVKSLVKQCPWQMKGLWTPEKESKRWASGPGFLCCQGKALDL